MADHAHDGGRRRRSRLDANRDHHLAWLEINALNTIVVNFGAEIDGLQAAPTRPRRPCLIPRAGDGQPLPRAASEGSPGRASTAFRPGSAGARRKDARTCRYGRVFRPGTALSPPMACGQRCPEVPQTPMSVCHVTWQGLAVTR